MNKEEYRQWLGYINKLKQQCKVDNIPFDLTMPYVRSIIKPKCALSRIPMVRGNNSMTRPVIMMIDRSKGYVTGNVMVVSYLALQCRETFNVDEFDLLVGKLQQL